MTSSPSTPPKNNSRWFLIMNVVIAIVVVSAIFLLKDSSSHYQPRAAYDAAYISLAKTETDPAILKHGIIHTEAARAHAYRSILKQANSTFILGLVISIAFIGNALFIYQLMRKQQLLIAEASAA